MFGPCFMQKLSTSSLAIILMGKRELVALLEFNCLLDVL